MYVYLLTKQIKDGPVLSIVEMYSSFVDTLYQYLFENPFSIDKSIVHKEGKALHTWY